MGTLKGGKRAGFGLTGGTEGITPTSVLFVTGRGVVAHERQDGILGRMIALLEVPEIVNDEAGLRTQLGDLNNYLSSVSLSIS